MGGAARSAAWVLVVVGVSAGAPRAVRADWPTAETSEPPELRALRAAERELFGPETRVDDALSESASTHGAPAILSSAAPESGQSIDASDASDGASLQASGLEASGLQASGLEASGLEPPPDWLEGMERPDLPFRWDARIVRYLELWRSDERGRAVMAALLQRSDRYAATLRADLRAGGLPEDLLYVAMVESGFVPTARSPAGAVGLWQFGRASAEEYGLRYDHWVDERRDPEKATRAAIGYLRALYDRFGGWELALAAYNMGHNGLVRSIRKYNTNDYWLLAGLEAGLPFETTLYVAKILACAIVGRNRARFGFEGLPGEEGAANTLVEVPGGVLLSEVARAASVPVGELEALNPELRRNRTPPSDAVWRVRIPTNAEREFTGRWRRQAQRTPQTRSHVVRFGETLANLATAYRTSEASLRTRNALATDEPIRVGLDLLVPTVDPVPRATVETVVAVPTETFAYEDRQRIFYRVIQGDRADEIAHFFEVRPEDLRQWNRIDAQAALLPGMYLQLFVPRDRDLSRALVLAEGEVRVLTVGSEEFFDYHESQRGRRRIRYRVEDGDTLASVASRFGLSTGSLARINRRGAARALSVGEEIIVYAPEPQAASAAPSAPPGGSERGADPESEANETGDAAGNDSDSDSDSDSSDAPGIAPDTPAL